MGQCVFILEMVSGGLIQNLTLKFWTRQESENWGEIGQQTENVFIWHYALETFKVEHVKVWKLVCKDNFKKRENVEWDCIKNK